MNKFLSFGFRFFASDIISGVGLSVSGQGYQALGPNCKREVLYSSFYWKISLLSLDWLSSVSDSKVSVK